MADKLNAWAIMGDCGLYYGTWYSRADAIAEHVMNFDQELYDGRRHWLKPADTPIGKRQRKLWAERKRAGDRAVKVTVVLRDQEAE